MTKHRLSVAISITRVVLFFIAFSTLASTPLCAQEQAPPVEDAPKAKGPAALRGWLLPGEDSKNLTLRLRSATGEAATVSLASSQGGSPSLAEPFIAVPVGSYLCELLEGDSVLLSKQVRLSDGKSMTLICLPSGDGKFGLRLFDDGPLPLPPKDRSLRILNFADGRQTSIQIEGREPLSVPAGAVLEAKLPPAQIPINVSVQATDGGFPAQSFAVVDLAATASSYVAVMSDAKGRMRPKLIAGAVPPPPEPTGPPPVPVPEMTTEQVQAERIAILERDLDSAVARMALLDSSKNSPNQGADASQLRLKLERRIADVRKRLEVAKSAKPETSVGQ